MSQYPSSFRRNLAPIVPRLGVAGGLEAPGLTPTAPDASPLWRANQLARALGLASQTFAEEAARIRREREREDEILAEEDRGLAKIHFDSKLPTIAREISEGKIPVPDDIGAAVDQMIAAETEGMSKAYADYYRSRRADIIRLFEHRKAQINAAADAESAALIAGSLSEATSPARAMAAIAAAKRRFPNRTHEQILSAVALPALKAAAASGDEARYRAVLSTIGEDHFKIERQEAEADFQRAVNQRRAQANQAFRQELDALFLARREGRTSFEEMRKWVTSRTDIDPSAREAALRDIDIRAEQSSDESRAALIRLEVEQAKAAIIDYAASLMRDAHESGGASQIEDSYTFPDSRGVEHTITRSEILDAVIPAEMERIARTEPPERVLGAQVQFLSSNGVTNPAWERVFSAGYLAASTDFAAIIEGKTDLPANLAAAYSLHKQLGAMNPRLRDAHIKNDAARRMFEIAELAEKYATPGDEPQALLMAVKAMARPTFSDSISRSLVAKDIHEAAATLADGGWFGRDAQNSVELGAKVEQLARFYVDTLGISATDAVKEAVARIGDSHTIINGWAVETGNILVPEGFADEANRIVREYIKSIAGPPEGEVIGGVLVRGSDLTRGEAEGVRARDLTLIPGETEGTWVLFNTRTLAPVDGWREKGFFTNADIARRIAERAEKERQERREKLMRDAILFQGRASGDQYTAPSTDFAQGYSFEMFPRPGEPFTEFVARTTGGITPISPRPIGEILSEMDRLTESQYRERIAGGDS